MARDLSSASSLGPTHVHLNQFAYDFPLWKIVLVVLLVCQLVSSRQVSWVLTSGVKAQYLYGTCQGPPGTCLVDRTDTDYAIDFTGTIAPDGPRTGQVTEEQPATLRDWFGFR